MTHLTHLTLTIECRVTAQYLAFCVIWCWGREGRKSFTRGQLLDEAQHMLTLYGEDAFFERRLLRNPRLDEARALVAELFPELAAPEVPA